MHADIPASSNDSPTSGSGPWYRELTRYHWFVFVVAALGWLFDTMDQQLFTLARPLAMEELITLTPKKMRRPERPAPSPMNQPKQLKNASPKSSRPNAPSTADTPHRSF